MKRTHSKAAFIRKRVKTVQGRAKFVGILYLLGAIALAAAVVCLPVLNGTAIGENGKLLPVLTFYKPIVGLFEGGFGSIVGNLKSLTAADVSALMASVFYGCMLLGVVFNVLRCFKKLKWLFKRRASYTNGFNRNMYAMDDLGKRFSGSLAAMINFYLLIYLCSMTGGDAVTYPQITMYGYIALGAGLVWHLFAGLIGGTVTLFTIGENVEEEPREFGLFTYFVRNVLQIVAVAAILYFFIPNSVVWQKFPEMCVAVLGGSITALINIPVIIEIVALLFIFILTKHATAATEFNRDCMDGKGMKNFAVFSLFTAIAFAALALLPMLGIGVETKGSMNVQLLIVAAIAFVAFLLDCIIKSRHSKVNYDDLGVEDYLRDGGEASKYNNTII